MAAVGCNYLAITILYYVTYVRLCPIQKLWRNYGTRATAGTQSHFFWHLYTDLFNKLQDTKEKLQQSFKEKEILKQTNASLHIECSSLQESIKLFQNKMDITIVLDHEMEILREQLISKDKALQEEIINHELHADELKRNYETEKEEALNSLRIQFTEELTNCNSQLKHEKDSKEKLLIELETSEKERKNEVSRIILQYEAKLTEAQRQKIQLVQQQHLGINNGVMRNRLQHMKENYETEITCLKAQILELQKQIEQLEKSNASSIQDKEAGSKIFLQQYQTVQNSDNRKFLLRNKRKLKNV